MVIFSIIYQALRIYDKEIASKCFYSTERHINGKLKKNPFYICKRHSQQYSQENKQKQIRIQKSSDHERKCKEVNITKDMNIRYASLTFSK